MKTPKIKLNRERLIKILESKPDNVTRISTRSPKFERTNCCLCVIGEMAKALNMEDFNSFDDEDIDKLTTLYDIPYKTLEVVEMIFEGWNEGDKSKKNSYNHAAKSFKVLWRLP